MLYVLVLVSLGEVESVATNLMRGVTTFGIDTQYLDVHGLRVVIRARLAPSAVRTAISPRRVAVRA
jgi:hypothetical protein